MTDALRRQVIASSQAEPGCWWEGYDASNSGTDAAHCPYTPMQEAKMMSWLSGHVTATDEREAA